MSAMEKFKGVQDRYLMKGCNKPENVIIRYAKTAA